MQSMQINKALAHLVWRFLNTAIVWWATLLRQKYQHFMTFEACAPRRSDSPIWKAMLRCKSIIIDNQRWVKGDGRDVRALDDY